MSALPKKQPRTLRRDGKEKRELIYGTAMRLFRERGFDATTMRHIAAEAGISLGSAYHYYPSKVAIVFDYYERVVGAHEQAVASLPTPSRLSTEERIVEVMLAKLELVRDDRRLLGHIAAAAVTPGDALSAFSPENSDLRERSVVLFANTLEHLEVDAHRELIATLLWVAHLGVLLYLVHDESESQSATEALIRQSARVLAPILGIATAPFAKPMIDGLIATLVQAGLHPSPSESKRT